MADRVLCTISDGIADVRLNRPDKLNALDDAMFTALAEASGALRERTDVRVVVLSGAGRGFCAGLDLAAFRAMADGRPFHPAGADATRDSQAPGAELSRGQRAALGWRALPVPVIAAVHGPALGGGLQIALGADIRIVAPDASLGLLELRWGITPDMGGTQLLPRLVGRDVATELILTGRTVNGTEAARIGLATRTAADPRAEALALAAEIAARNPDAVRMGKRLLELADTAPLAEGLALERHSLRTIVGSPNQREAAKAALEKRAPQFVDVVDPA